MNSLVLVVALSFSTPAPEAQTQDEQAIDRVLEGVDSVGQSVSSACYQWNIGIEQRCLSLDFTNTAHAVSFELLFSRVGKNSDYYIYVNLHCIAKTADTAQCSTNSIRLNDSSKVIKLSWLNPHSSFYETATINTIRNGYTAIKTAVNNIFYIDRKRGEVNLVIKSVFVDAPDEQWVAICTDYNRLY